MKAATALRIAVIAEIVMMLVGVGVAFWIKDWLPPELLEFQQNQPDYLMDEKVPPLIRGGLIAALILVLGATLASIVGLLKLKPWGAWLYLLSVALLLPTYFGFGYAICHPIDQIYTEIYGIIQGMIIGLAFFSDAIPRNSGKRSGRMPPDAL